MSGFNKIAKFVDFCQRKFYARCRWLLRKKQSKGHGVHSPFAFDLITNVIHSPYSFYTFSDIPEILSQKGIDPYLISRFNHLSFRLVHYLQAKDILEVNSGNGINTLFLTAPSSRINCKCIEKDIEKITIADRLQKQTGRKWKTDPSLLNCDGEHYNAIFVNLRENDIPDIRLLMELSRPDAFWVLHPIKRGTTKQFWNEIVHDVRARVTFELKDTGIVFLRQDLRKANYLV